MGSRKAAKNRIGISQVFLFYWIALVIWQNLSRASARSGFDLILKIGLILLLTAFYFLRSRYVSKNIIVIFAFAICMLLTFWLSGDTFSGSNIIAYVYPVLLAFLVFGLGNHFQINRREFIGFLNGIVAVVMYMALYAIVFCADQFRYAFLLKGAYGNELTSFFSSSHEYGMYLVYAIFACLICIELKRGEPLRKKLKYVIAIVIFVPNLVLTFSRTSMLAMAVIIFMYCFANAQARLRKWMIAAVVGACIVVMLSSQIQNLIRLVLFKGEDGLGDREVLYRLAIELFLEGDSAQKLFGYGMGIRDVFETYANHGSVHNAYLQVLMYFGLAGVTFLTVLLFSQIMSAVRLYGKSKFFAAISLILVGAAMALMFTNTTIIFMSPIDCFFLTMVTILVPKYVRNSIYSGSFER